MKPAWLLALKLHSSKGCKSETVKYVHFNWHWAAGGQKMEICFEAQYILEKMAPPSHCWLFRKALVGNTQATKILGPGMQGISEAITLRISLTAASFPEQLVILYYLSASSRLITNHIWRGEKRCLKGRFAPVPNPASLSTKRVQTPLLNKVTNEALSQWNCEFNHLAWMDKALQDGFHDLKEPGSGQEKAVYRPLEEELEKVTY